MATTDARAGDTEGRARSAAMYLYADHAVRTGALPLFDDLLAAKPASAVASEVNDIIVRAGGGPV